MKKMSRYRRVTSPRCYECCVIRKTRVIVFVVVRERLFVNASHHLYVVIAVALSSPLIITTLVVILMLLHRRRWLDWRKSSVPVHHRQRSQTSPALQQLLQPTDARWELNPTM